MAVKSNKNVLTGNPFAKINVPLWFKIIFVFCGAYLSLVFNVQSTVFYVQAFKGNKSIAFACICAVVLFVLAGLVFLMFKWKFLEKLLERLGEKPLWARIVLPVFAAICAGTYIAQFYGSLTASAKHLGETENWWFHIFQAFGFTGGSGFTPPRWILSFILFIPLTVFYIYMVMSFTEIIKSVLTTLSGNERKFLIIASVVSVVYIVFLYNSSSVYYGGLDRIYSYDSLPDSSYLINPFYYWSYYQYPIEPNFSLPIIVFANMLAPMLQLWGIIMRTVVQFLLLLVAIIMLSRMISEDPMVRLCSMLIFVFSFPVVILAAITERRVITLVFLIIAMYQSIHEKDRRDEDDNFWLSAASGAVICNAYVALLSVKSKKTFIRDAFVCGCVFLFLAAFLGKISGLLDLQSQINNFENSGWIDGELNTKTKLLHYLNLVCSSFFAPPSLANMEKNRWEMAVLDSGSFNYLHILGIAIIALAIAGFVLNYKNRFAQTAFTAILASIFFVYVKALNINENAVVLNTLFFAWAFVSLNIMAVDKLLKKPKAKKAVLAVMFCACYCVSILAAYQLYSFGVVAYPS